MALNPIASMTAVNPSDGLVASSLNKEASSQSAVADFAQLFQRAFAQMDGKGEVSVPVEANTLTDDQQAALENLMDAMSGFLETLENRSVSLGGKNLQADALHEAVQSLADALQAFFASLPEGQKRLAEERDITVDGDQREALEALFGTDLLKENRLYGGDDQVEMASLQGKGHAAERTLSDEEKKGGQGIDLGSLVQGLARLGALLAHQNVADRHASKIDEDYRPAGDGAAILAAPASQAAGLRQLDTDPETEYALANSDKTGAGQTDVLKSEAGTQRNASDVLMKRLATLHARLQQLAAHASVAAADDKPNKTAPAETLVTFSSIVDEQRVVSQEIPLLAHAVRNLLNPRMDQSVSLREGLIQRFEQLSERPVSAQMTQGDTGNGAMNQGQGQPSSTLGMLRTDAGQLPSPAQSAIALPLRHPDWGKALAQRVMVLAQNNQQLAQVRLHPAHLGPIQIKMKLDKDQSVQVSLHAHHALTREAIEQALPRLREMFDQQGLNLAGVTVSPDEQSHAQAFADARREGQAEGRGGAAPHAQADIGAEEELAVRQWTRVDALVDHFV
ncbi:Flagellar hook-length control protein FliK [Sulfurivirga caldicuralii]|uniref:Flagellar hook-length control protein FliK n=1 Tax=Sulfurivirga caldicuralii TaxID=364032 RepID=A0A1N6FLU5_9GAMM|nr:flagellar hook-length control protein FliK [Sulfurivirga caldicuralii]SIN96225.1 Flagellar hook-length control protein FliK [Sulfurivirga caldicuralii]